MMPVSAHEASCVVPDSRKTWQDSSTLQLCHLSKLQIHQLEVWRQAAPQGHKSHTENILRTQSAANSGPSERVSERFREFQSISESLREFQRIPCIEQKSTLRHTSRAFQTHFQSFADTLRTYVPAMFLKGGDIETDRR
jgi:hypothetical protein